MVEAHKSSGRLGIHRLISKEVYTYYYPLHEVRTSISFIHFEMFIKASLDDGIGADGKLNDRQVSFYSILMV